MKFPREKQIGSAMYMSGNWNACEMNKSKKTTRSNEQKRLTKLSTRKKKMNQLMKTVFIAFMIYSCKSANHCMLILFSESDDDKSET